MSQHASQLLRKSRKLARIAQVHEYRFALRHGVAATVEHESVPFGSDHRTVVDVGAGVGQFAVFARRRFPTAEIHCFEPLPGSAAKARRVLGHLPGVELHEVAIGDQAGRATVHVTADRHSSSLLRPTTEQARRFPGTEEVNQLSVEVRTLDEMIVDAKPSVLLKIDLQGGELAALRGAESLLRGVTEVFVEASFVELYEGQPLAGDVVTYLTGLGFLLSGVYSLAYGSDGTCLQADLLFRRSPLPIG